MSAATFIWAKDENGNDVMVQLPLRVQIAADSSTPVPVQQAHLTATNDTVSAVILADELTPVPVQQAALTAATDTVSVGSGEAHIGEVGLRYAKPSANFTRPSDTNAYALGDLIANSTTAASVVPMQWSVARVAAGSGVVKRVRMKKSSPVITNASFRLHLYNTDPSLAAGIVNGDNGAWLTNHSGYIGAMDAVFEKVFSDASAGNGLPLTGPEITFALASGQVIFGLLESRAAYVPISGEVFTLDLEVAQN